MKKIKFLIPVLVIALIASLFAFADVDTQESEPEIYTLQGVISEITTDGILLSTPDMGEVLVKIDEETIFDMEIGYAAGDYLFIDYDGMMTRSIPAQITADLIRMYILAGEVTEMYDEENAMLVTTQTHGEVYVTLPEYLADVDFAGESVVIYFDGAMTMSIPPQINAAHVIMLDTIQGTVKEIVDGYLTINDGETDWLVNCSTMILPENMNVGDVIAVRFDGRVLPHETGPAEIRALELVQVSR